jgi:hypothetical protein
MKNSKLIRIYIPSPGICNESSLAIVVISRIEVSVKTEMHQQYLHLKIVMNMRMNIKIKLFYPRKFRGL